MRRCLGLSVPRGRLVGRMATTPSTARRPERRRRIRREVDPGPRRPRRCPQATRHVHRQHRLRRPAPPGVGADRQRGRRGRRRSRQLRRGHPAQGQVDRGGRQRPRHPDRQEGRQAHRARVRLHRAARRRQVRLGRLRRVGRPPRRGRVGGQRAGRQARRRGRPRRHHPAPLVQGARARSLRRQRQVRPDLDARDRAEDPGEAHRHPSPLLGRLRHLRPRRRDRDRSGPRPRRPGLLPRPRPQDPPGRQAPRPPRHRRDRPRCAVHRGGRFGDDGSVHHLEQHNLRRPSCRRRPTGSRSSWPRAASPTSSTTSRSASRDRGHHDPRPGTVHREGAGRRQDERRRAHVRSSTSRCAG